MNDYVVDCDFKMLTILISNCPLSLLVKLSHETVFVLKS